MKDVFFRLPWVLKRDRPMGINSRNLDGIARLNPVGQMRWLDNKILTREICIAADVPCPDIFGIVRNRIDISKVGDRIIDLNDFVIKPARGAKGKGILIITKQSGDLYIGINNRTITLAEIEHHLNEILQGVFSRSEFPDEAVIEQRIAPHDTFRGLSPAGTPDIRIVLINAEPVMAMLRIPTVRSRGRANLSMGAVAAGIDMQSGLTVGGILHSRVTSQHPDTGGVLSDFPVPFWQEMLTMSKRFAGHIEAGYVGIDIILDNCRGPLFLEANNRPGLQIQLANQRSLKPHLCLSKEL